MMPEVTLPENFVRESLTISQDGRVNVKIAGSNDPVEVGQLEIYRFVNPPGLSAVEKTSTRLPTLRAMPSADVRDLTGWVKPYRNSWRCRMFRW